MLVLGLLYKLLDMAKKEKIKRIILEVSNHNIAAINMYKKLGFKKLAKEKIIIELAGLLDAYLMEKNIN